VVVEYFDDDGAFKKKTLEIYIEEEFAAEMMDLARIAANSYKQGKRTAFAGYMRGDPDLISAFKLAQRAYTPERTEIILDPSLYLLIGKGDCDDQAIFLSAFLLAQGVGDENLFLIFMSFDDQEEDHVAVMFTGDVQGLVLDPVPGYSFGDVSAADDVRVYQASKL